tara:strand:+ start:63 stop:1583 length:1521 start_codon:yes stop_codon:yes gene_type:complete
MEEELKINKEPNITRPDLPNYVGPDEGKAEHTVGPLEVAAGAVIAPGLVMKAVKAWGVSKVVDAGMQIAFPDAEDTKLEQALEFNKPIKTGIKATRLMYEKVLKDADVYSKSRFSSRLKREAGKEIINEYLHDKAAGGPYKNWQDQNIPQTELSKDISDVARKNDLQYRKNLNPDQLKLFNLPTDPAGKEAFRIFSENIAVKSGYESLAKFKKEVLNRWPQKDVDQLFRELWSNQQYEGYIEHLTAKGSHMDWYWNMKGLDRNAVNNVRILYNDNLKNLKDTVEKIVYGSPNNPGLGWQSPNLADRLIVSFEDPMKRAKVYNRQNPGDIIIKRAGNDQIIGNLGQYLDTLYPQDALAKRMFEDGVAKLGLTPAEFRRQILEQRIGIIIENSATLPKNATKRKRYIKQFIDDDMVDLTEQYPFLQSKQSIKEAIDTPGSGITEADYDLRGQGKNPIPPLGDPKFQKKGPFPSKTDILNIEKAKRKGYTQGSIFDQINNILRPDRIDE